MPNNLVLTGASYDTSGQKFGSGALNAGYANAPLNIAAMPFAIGVWFKFASAPTATQVMVGANYFFWLGFTASGFLHADFGGKTVQAVGVTAASQPSANVWHYATLSVSAGNGLTLTMDGTVVGNIALNATNNGSTTDAQYGPFAVRTHGGYESAGTFQFNAGELDELSVWNSDKFTSAFTPQTSAYTGSETGLLALWHLDGNGLDSAVTAATAYTLTGPASGTVGAASTPYTVTAVGALASAVTVTPSDSSGGGTFSPTTVTLAAGTNTTATFTYSAASAGTKSISTSNGGSLTNPAALSYAASAASGFVIRALGRRGGLAGANGKLIGVSIPSVGGGNATSYTTALSSANLTMGGVTTASILGNANFVVGQTFTPVLSGLTGTFDQPMSGTFSGGVLTVTNANPSASLRFTASSVGSGTIAFTSSPALTNTSGAQALTVTASAAATHLTLTQPNPSSGASGTTFSIQAAPVGGNWASGTIVSATATGATCSNSGQTAPAGTTTPVTLSFTSTGAGGTNAIATITATGMTNDAGAETFVITLPVSGGGGTAPATLTVGAFNNNLANQLFSRDSGADSGNPAGSPSTFGKGWATIKFPITSSAAVSGTALLMRLRDRDNPGTVLVDWTQTGTNAMASGANTVSVVVPAGPYLFIADFGYNGSQNTYASTPNAFAPGYLVVYSGPSICSNSLGTVAGNSNADISSAITFNPKTFYLGTGSNSPTGKWVTAGDNSSSFYSLSALGLNREFADKGIPIAFIDTSLLGQGIEPYDLEGQSYTGNAITQALGYVGLSYRSGNNATGNELFDVVTYGRIDALCIDGYNGSASQSPDYYASEMASLYKGVVGLVDKPFDFVVGFQEYTGGENYDRKVKEILVSKISRAHMFWEKNWPGSAPNGHPGQAYKAYHQGVNWVQARRVAHGTSSEPPLIASATRAAGSADIYLTIANNGTALGGWQAVTPGGGDVGMTVTSDATSAQLATMFSLLAPGSQDVSGPTAIAPTACTIVSATQIKLTFPDTLSGRPQSGDNDYDLLYDVIITNYNSQDIVSVRDNVLDAGTPYGRALQQTLTPVYVPKPSAPAAAITLSAISALSTGISIRALALTAATGTWIGTSVPSSIDFSVDGGAYVTSVDTHILSNGTWRATFLAPAVAASHTLQARITGGSAVSGSLSFATTATDYPAGAVADLDIRLLGNLFKDAGRTQAAAHLDRLNGYTDPTGNGAHFQQYTGRGAPGPREIRNLALSMPAIHSQSSFYNYHNFYPPTGYPDLVSTALPGLITGSFTTFFTALKPNTGGGGAIIGGKPTSASGYNFLMGIGAGAYVIVQPNNGGSSVQANSPTDLSGKMVHAVARCDVTNNVIKIKTYGEAEVSATGMPSGANSWAGVDIGYGGIGGDNNARASIYRAGFYPGLLSDTDVNALLATSYRLFGA